MVRDDLVDTGPPRNWEIGRQIELMPRKRRWTHTGSRLVRRKSSASAGCGPTAGNLRLAERLEVRIPETWTAFKDHRRTCAGRRLSRPRTQGVVAGSLDSVADIVELCRPSELGEVLKGRQNVCCGGSAEGCEPLGEEGGSRRSTTPSYHT